MKKLFNMSLLVSVLTLWSLFTTGVLAFEVITETETVVVNDVEIDIVRTADNFIILFDSSGSMGETYKNTGQTKLETAKALLKKRNENLPDLSYVAGLYTFTPRTGSFSLKTLKPVYEMKPYNKVAFAAAIERLPDQASGPTLLQQGLSELDQILEGLLGRTVVFVFTDGKYYEREKMNLPREIARKLATKHNVCFYVISNAPGKLEAQLLEGVASINACSRVIDFDDLVERPEYTTGALFVVERAVIPRAFDIEKIVDVEMKNILFDYNEIDLNPAYAPELDALGKFLKDTPRAYVVLCGFSDSIGSQEYNLDLSRQRAEAVSGYLTGQFSIDPDRIVLNWYGKAAPRADNDTPVGRQLNRRVEVVVIGL
jgi:OOP family OmpA-OmpF porin